MIRVLCCVPLLVLFHLGQSAPTPVAEPSPVAGNATEAAVPTESPPAQTEAPSASRNATEAAVPGENLFASAGAPEQTAAEGGGEETPPVVIHEEDDILLSHVYTYDPPQGKNLPWPTTRVFVLNARIYSSEPTDNLTLYTNVGIGTARSNGLGPVSNNSVNVELLCTPKADDDCEADRIIIYGATSFARGYGDTYPKVRDVSSRLRLNPTPRLTLETKKGLLPLPGARRAAKPKVAPDIRMANDYYSPSKSGFAFLRLTFPPGERERYSGFLVTTSRGYNDEWKTEGVKPAYGTSNSALLWVTDFDWEEHARWHEPGVPAYVPETAGTLGEKGVFIKEAWAFEGKKKIDLLPRLVQDPFKPLPLRTKDGLLPTVPLKDM